jgi:hypothetical protein
MLARLLGAVLLVAGLLPIANWIGGGHDAPWYAERVALWSSGGGILLGVAAIAFIVVRRRPESWREGAWQRLAARWDGAGWRADLVVAALAVTWYALIAQRVLSATPLLIDEIVQVWQARVLASGRLWVPTPEQPEFTAIMHLADIDGRRFGQFPVGGPLMLMLGTLVGAEWLVGPMFAGLAVLCWARVLRGLVPPGVGLAAVLLFAVTPFWMFLGGSMMNHVTVTTWLLLAAVGVARATRDAAARPRWALLVGVALGVAATIRPMDAAAFALPTAAWLLWRARGGASHVVALLASGVGIAGPLACLLYANAQQTGDPLLFGYVALWGQSHELGFHAVPWGPPHTPLRGLELVNLYLLRLQSYLFETPGPGLLFATGALLLGRGWSAVERWAVASSALLLLAYWAYWHDGFYLGPRFLLPLAPWLVLWTARLPGALADARVSAPVRHGVLAAGVAALAIGGATLVPIRWQQYRNGMLSMRLDPTPVLQAAGVPEGATVLVRESWGAQVIARMWGLGVSRVAAEQYYRTADLCRLDEVVSRVEAEGGGASRVAREVAVLQADSTRLVSLTVSPDSTARMIPRSTLAPACARRVMEDRAGFTVLATVLVARGGRVQYARDLHARSAPLLEATPGQPSWLLTQAPEVGGGLRVERINLDSARAEWGSR